MVDFHRLEDADVENQRALVRVDFNVPCDENGVVTDDTRMRAAIPTIKTLRACGAKTILLSHFGRPCGHYQASASLLKLVAPLSELLGSPVGFGSDCVGDAASEVVKQMKAGDVILLENTRFHSGEEKTKSGEKGYAPDFANALASLGDLFVNDAFSVAHRAQASTVGIAEFLPAYAGLAMERELDHISQALDHAKPPVIGIVGGAKVSTKIAALENLVTKLDHLVIGGGMANTFLAALGHPVGKSLCEYDLLPTARTIMAAAKTAHCEILLPIDVVCAKEFKAGAKTTVRDITEVQDDDMILDAGSETVNMIADAIDVCRTLIWNGPLGAFETPPFDTSTVEVAKYTAWRAKDRNLIAVAGGGDTVSALNLAGVVDDFTFVSTAGGAFLEWMEGNPLPGVEILKKH